MSHPRVEDLSDSDPDEMDIDQIMPSQNQNESLMNPGNIPHQDQQRSPPAVVNDPKRYKHWTCLYPLYFDASRSRAQGRRIGKELAVPNPLAREICDAIFGLKLQMAFEADKTHPKDWANPGRVRVLLKEDGQPVNREVPNKHALYIKVAKHLEMYPANEKTPLRLPIAGMPNDNKPPPPPAIPRRWRMNEILPLHSNALSGGGVSENIFKDIMADMQGQGVDPSTGGSNAGKSSKKDKKKVKG